MLSIIVPVYNAERFLRRCVDSVLAQTHTDFELLLIDDGSTDGSPAICDEYAALDSRIRVFHKPNGGVSSARNLGLDHARGEWICFIDSDDEINNLEALDALNYESDIILFTMKIIKNDESSYCEKTSLPDGLSETKNNFILNYLHFHIFNSVCAKLIRKSIIGNLRFESDIRFGEDALFTLLLVKSAAKISLCDKVEYIYHREADYEKKYQSSAASSIKTMQKIFNAYWALECRNLAFERNVFNCYRSICRDEWLQKPSLWNDNETVSFIYTEIKDAFTLKNRLRYSLTTSILYNLYRNLKHHLG